MPNSCFPAMATRKLHVEDADRSKFSSFRFDAWKLWCRSYWPLLQLQLPRCTIVYVSISAMFLLLSPRLGLGCRLHNMCIVVEEDAEGRAREDRDALRRSGGRPQSATRNSGGRHHWV